MDRSELTGQIQLKQSFLCVGLDTDIARLPEGIEKSTRGMLEFNRAIIEKTAPYAIAYKVNTAFYEQYGAEGWKCMEDTLALIPAGCLSIADAKRGDIGNTSTMYARAFFERLSFDAITVAPYMGEDSLKPFLEFKDKWVICLGLTSNAGSKDFQVLESGGEKLYEHVIKKVSSWGTPSNLMFVTGATKASDLEAIRKIAPDHFFLVPGVGAQGGTIEEVCKYAMTDFGGLVINASRSILYASQGKDFAEKAEAEAKYLQQECEKAMKASNILTARL